MGKHTVILGEKKENTPQTSFLVNLHTTALILDKNFNFYYLTTLLYKRKIMRQSNTEKAEIFQIPKLRGTV